MLIDASASIVDHADGSSAIKRVTHFDDTFLSSLQSERDAKAHLRYREMDRVASVPTHVADIWLNQVFDIYRASPREIVARLRKEGLEAFITTNKTS